MVRHSMAALAPTLALLTLGCFGAHSETTSGLLQRQPRDEVVASEVGGAGTADAGSPRPVDDASPSPDAANALGADRTAATRVTIAATGDLVMSHRIARAWRARGDDGLAWMLERFRSLLSEDDIVYLNIETPLVDDVVPRQTGWPPVLGAPPGVAEVLAAIGVDVVGLANNHAYDQGHEGLGRTIELLDDAGIRHAGAGPTVDAAYTPTVVERGGVRVAFLSFTGPMNLQVSAAGATPQHVARLWDEERVLRAVGDARSDADIVVVLAHWSRDFAPGVPRELRRLAHRIVDAGADVILGTGPHILHEVDRFESERGEAVVAYSLGNLLSSMAFRHRYGQPTRSGYVHPANVIPEARDGVVLRISLELSEDRIDVSGLTATPLWTSNNHAAHIRDGVPLEIRVVPLDEAPEAIARERRPLIEAALGEHVELL